MLRVTEKDLIRQAVLLAQRTRLEIQEAGLQVTDFSGVVQKYGIQLEWADLPIGEYGLYSKDERKITLSIRVTNPESGNFNFCHEFMHDCIEHYDDLLSLFADAHIRPGSDYEVMERLCNAGGAELLMPSEDVRQMMLGQGFSTSLIHDLCERFEASSIAVAFQMVNCASHDCYLVIAEPQIVSTSVSTTATLMPMIQPDDTLREQLVIIYSGASSQAKYSIKRHQIIPVDHMLYQALRTDNSVRGDAKIPFASGNGWNVPCDALEFRGKVFAFFNVTQPVSHLQMRLL
jgi:Zn-dependent peptidase ImmA (M78 family)